MRHEPNQIVKRFATTVVLMVTAAFIANAAGAYVISFDTAVSCNRSLVHKIPISHNREGVVERGNVIERAATLPDNLKISSVNGLGAALFQFTNGCLTLFQRNGNEQTKAKDIAYLSANSTSPLQLPELWRVMPNDANTGWKYWEKSSRLRLWFYNPNGAGALFAEIALVLFAIVVLIIKNNLLRVVLGGCAVASTILLLMTGSRGSLIALVASVIVVTMAYIIFRNVKVRETLAVSLIIVAASVFAVLAFSSNRFGRNLLSVDAGNVQRLRAWRSAPAMIAAAPNGWGDNCGQAYCEWFQEESDSHVLYYLVNTHLTWMAGKGWLFSGVYVFGWVLLFAMLLANFRNRWSALALAMWTLFFIANWFSTLGQFASLWVIPSLCAIPAAVEWTRNFKSMKLRYAVACMAAALAAAGVVYGVISIGRADLAKAEISVRNDGNAVYVGTGEPIVYVVPDQWVLCRYEIGGMGRDIRAWCRSHAGEGTIAVVDSIDKLPPKPDRLVLVGRACLGYMSKMKKAAKDKKSFESFPRAKQTVFISPNLSIKKIGAKLAHALHLKVYTGEFLAEVAEDLGAKAPWAKIVPGCELYLPDWMDLAMG